jgi:hypothetical protein
MSRPVNLHRRRHRDGRNAHEKVKTTELWQKTHVREYEPEVGVVMTSSNVRHVSELRLRYVDALETNCGQPYRRIAIPQKFAAHKCIFVDLTHFRSRDIIDIHFFRFPVGGFLIDYMVCLRYLEPFRLRSCKATSINLESRRKQQVQKLHFGPPMYQSEFR